MQIAHIVPTAVTPKGKIHMLLLHLCAQEVYKLAYKDVEGYKIMDNSVVELGTALTIEKLCDVAEEMDVDEIVLPDVLGDGIATLAAVKDAIKYIFKRYGNDVPFKLMAVAQGNTLDEWMNCHHDLIQLPVHVIGIPKRVEQFIPRYELCEILEAARDPYKDYHLLGVPGNPIEIWHAKRLEYIRSVDSCIAYIAARDGVAINPLSGCDRPEKTIDFTDTPSESTLGQLQQNIDTMNGWVAL